MFFFMSCLQQCVHIPLIFNYLNNNSVFDFNLEIIKIIKSECVWLGPEKDDKNKDDDEQSDGICLKKHQGWILKRLKMQ